jgi:fatty-acyl-CoA synthase
LTGSASTLPEAVTEATSDARTVQILRRDGTYDSLSHQEIVARARQVAGGLIRVGAASRLAAVATTSLEFVVLALGILLSGSTLVVLAPPQFGASRKRWGEALATQMRVARATLIAQEGTVPPGIHDAVAFSGLPRVEPTDLPSLVPEAHDVISFSSGTTGAQKGIVTSHAARFARWEAATSAGLAASTTDEVSVSWMPLSAWTLFHGVFYPLASRSSAVLIPPRVFSADPLSWLQAISDRGGVRGSASASLYATLARALTSTDRKFDLSTWSRAVIGNERIDLATVDRFTEAARPHGFDPEAWRPLYGTTELGGLTTTPPGERIHVDHVSGEALTAGLATPSGPSEKNQETEIALVSVGRVRPSVSLRIEDEVGAPVADRTIGEIVAGGPGTMSGYLLEDGTIEEVESGALLRTGDLGYLAEERLFVTGRRKNIVIIRGRNYACEDLELVVERAAGRDIARCAVIGISSERGEDVVLVAELRHTGERGTVSPGLRQALFSSFGVSPREIALVPKGALPVTSTLKIDRTGTKAAYERGDYDPYIC